MTIKGLDISSQSENISYNRIKKNDIKFVMIRAGFTDYDKRKTKIVDSKFEENYRSARKHNLKIGVYYCSRATTIKEAEDEVNYFLSIIDGKTFEYPTAIQIEDDHNTVIYYPYNQESIEKIKLLSIVNLMNQKIKNKGYNSLIRTYEKWYKNIFMDNKTYMYNFWIDDLQKDNNNYDIYSTENDIIYSNIDYTKCNQDDEKVEIIVSEDCLINKIKSYIKAGYKILKSKIRK